MSVELFSFKEAKKIFTEIADEKIEPFVKDINKNIKEAAEKGDVMISKTITFTYPNEEGERARHTNLINYLLDLYRKDGYITDDGYSEFKLVYENKFEQGTYKLYISWDK